MAFGWAAALATCASNARVGHGLAVNAGRAWWHLPATYQARRIVTAEHSQVTSAQVKERQHPGIPWHPVPSPSAPRGATSYSSAFLTLFYRNSRTAARGVRRLCGIPLV